MENKNFTGHVEFVVLLITLIGGFYLLDGKIERQSERQSERTDKLYEMFIQVQNEIKDLHARSCVIETKILEMKK
jgi:hypothetical protein